MQEAGLEVKYPELKSVLIQALGIIAGGGLTHTSHFIYNFFQFVKVRSNKPIYLKMIISRWILWSHFKKF